MRIFIIGANGKTGTQLIDLGLARGHHLTAFVRSPDKITRRHERLRVVAGDPLSAEALAAALPGHDVVMSALGVRFGEIFRPVTLVAEGAASVVAAMTQVGVARLLLVSAATLFPEKGLRFAFFRWLLAQQIRDLVAAEAVVRASGLAWTLARPPRLTQAADEAYRSAVDALPANGFVVSYRALAAFMLDAAEQQRHTREIVGLARP